MSLIVDAEHKNPEWLNQTYFENILKHSKNNPNITVIAIQFKPAAEKGAYYGSSMYRVIIKYSTSNHNDHCQSVIVKMMSKDKCLASTYNFETEMKMYTTIVPAMEKILRSTNDNTTFGGHMLYHSDYPVQHMVFEDLCESNYVIPLRGNTLGYEGAKLVYEKLAKWHATSYYLAIVDGMDFTNFHRYMFDNESCTADITELGVSCADAINATFEKEWPEFEKYREHLNQFVKNMKEVGIETYKPKPKELKGFNVLNHGDLHPKNIMVKYYENGKIIDVLFLDFQLAIYGSPAFDIGYSMFNLLEEEIRGSYRDELIYIYHEEFKRILNRLNRPLKIPSMIDLQIELTRNGFVEVFTWLTLSIFHFADFKNYEVGDLFQRYSERGRKARMEIFQLPEMRKICKKYLKHFVHVGFL